MASIGIVEFMRVTDGTIDRALFQNYWPGQFVDGYAYMPFESSGITSNQSGIQDQMSIVMPAIPNAFSLAQAATSSAWLIEISVYQFPITTAGTTPPSSKTLTSRFYGEVIGGSMNLSDISLQIGSSLTPVGVVVPARRFTTALIGSPPKL